MIFQWNYYAQGHQKDPLPSGHALPQFRYTGLCVYLCTLQPPDTEFMFLMGSGPGLQSLMVGNWGKDIVPTRQITR